MQKFGGNTSTDSMTCVDLFGTKIVGGGQFLDSNGKIHMLVARMNSDGSADTTFGFGGVTTFQFDSGAAAETVKGIAVDPGTGKITVLGFSVDDIDGTYETFIMRFNSNGSVDTAFGTRKPFDVNGNPDTVAGMSIKRKSSDGSVVALATDVDLSSGGTFFKVARLDINGNTIGSVIKDNFSSAVAGNTAYDVAINNLTGTLSGKFVVVGQTPPINGKQLMGFVRYNADGTADTTFGPSGKKQINIQFFLDSQRATGVTWDASNRIVAVGRPDTVSDNNNGAIVYVARLADGSQPQTTLNAISGTTVVSSAMPTWRVAASGNDFYVTGNAHLNSFEEFATVKFLGSSFAVDANFGTSGHVLTGVFAANAIASGVVVQSDGKPVVGGTYD